MVKLFLIYGDYLELLCDVGRVYLICMIQTNKVYKWDEVKSRALIVDPRISSRIATIKDNRAELRQLYPNSG